MKRTSTQHDLMVRVLEAAGGQAIETLVPTGYMGSIADILFAEDDVIVDQNINREQVVEALHDGMALAVRDFTQAFLYWHATPNLTFR